MTGIADPLPTRIRRHADRVSRPGVRVPGACGVQYP